MKKLWFALVLCLALLWTGCGADPVVSNPPVEDESVSSTQTESGTVVVDFFCINDLHGKFADGDNHPGVDEMTTYFEQADGPDNYVVLLSSGDMWQGSAESNMTHGQVIVDWMNELDFAAMAMGNHEYDWGEDAIEANAAMAEFPFLGINIFDVETGERVDYCESSTMVDCGGIQIGIIGAIGDCYSSIAVEKVDDVYFMVGDDLTRLVMEESTRLRAAGADFIIYLLHDGLGDSKSSSVTPVGSGQLSGYYDTALSNGYVDLVFEAHTHQRYLLQDEYGVYHLQYKGDNKGITHVEVRFDGETGRVTTKPELVVGGDYATLEDAPIVGELLEKYDEQISPARKVLGTNAQDRRRNELRQLVADLYYEEALERWGRDYDIVLAGGFISVRDPGHLSPGEVTYAQLQTLFPFDNELVLCTIQGDDLLDRFFESDNSNYFICYGDYGAKVRSNIDPNKTYYIVVDTYSSTYAPNRLTEVERYGAELYARDLLADYVEQGGLN